MSEEIFGSPTRCCVCGIDPGLLHIRREDWYENQTEYGNPARKVWHCASCTGIMQKAVEAAGPARQSVSFWTRGQNEAAILRACGYYKATHKAPAAEPKPVAKSSWEEHAKKEREVAASQHAIDAEARLRQATHELDRPSTPRYPQVYLTADMGGNPWSRR